MMILGARCWFCQEDVDDRACRMVIGWEEPRRAGGANKIMLRQATGDMAHKTCVEAARLDRNRDQTAMFQ